jgi:phospho-N-acetylmuramoyl-pentapeptide-transferase
MHTIETLSILKVFLPAILSFLVGLAITPTLSRWFYKWRLWKSTSRQDQEVGQELSNAYKEIHNEDAELHTPRVGGVIIWGSALIAMALMFLISRLVPSDFSLKLDFLSRNQTLLPMLALLLGGALGLFEDMLEIVGTQTRWMHGLPKWFRIGVVTIIGAAFAWWFFDRLGVSSVAIPFVGQLELGWLYLVFFIVVTLGTFSSRVIDGLDGLAGGVMISAFSSYAMIALLQNQIDLAAFCAVVVGGLLVFLWFNIPPARFWMGETGMLALTLALTIVAFLTGQEVLLLVIGLPLVATSLSSLIQILAKKYWNKKVFKIAPLHHHFQALGWPAHRVTMRYWVISLVCGALGVILAILG